MRTHKVRDGEAGQVVPLVALMMVALIGFMALAIDVSNVYQSRRFYRAVADAASLAGGQDLQTTSRTIGSADYTRARTHALQVLKDKLGATGDPTGCPTTADMADCALPGTAYRISIRTPISSSDCVSCDGTHSIQVNVRNPSFGLTFSRVLGFGSFNVASNSVAGLTFSSKYALMTLQPPKPRNNGTDANIDKDLIVNGNNTLLNILQGDAGTNTSATTTNQGEIRLADGYFIDHYDDLAGIGPTWSQTNGKPVGRQIGSLIQDPNYPMASFTTAPSYTQATGAIACSGANYPSDTATLNFLTTAATGGTITCYQPGVYSSFNVANKDVAYLMPGAYQFPNGMVVRGSLAGGLINGQPGVVIVIPQTQTIDSNNALGFILNTGGVTCAALSCRATAATDFGTPTKQMQTADGLVLTIEVPRDGNCFSGTTPIISGSCAVNQNNTVNLAGGGFLRISGIIYGPSDNMQIHGQAGQVGELGQIVSWSVTYTGGSTLNQSYPGGEELGLLRLDGACTAPGTPCSP